MPVYEFYCSECHKIYQFFARDINNRKIPDCPVCGKKKLSKEISTFSFINSLKVNNEELLPENGFNDQGKIYEALQELSVKSGALEHSGADSTQKMQEAARAVEEFFGKCGINSDEKLVTALKDIQQADNIIQAEEELNNELNAADYSVIVEQIKKYKQYLSAPYKDDKLYDL